MSRKNKKFIHQANISNASSAISATSTDSNAHVFTFGDPEPVLDTRSFWDYLECGFNGQWYEPPVPLDGLSRTFRANTHHETALRIKRNLLAKTFIPHKLMNKQKFSAWALDYLIYGNAYLERRRAITGSTVELKHALGKFMRRCRDLENYVFVHNSYTSPTPYTTWEPYKFETGSVFHLLEPDINQEVYGLPEYLSALQSIWLNEESTLFRRKYYKNGSHAGFILYMNDPKIAPQDVEAIKKQLKDSKGLGNFKNLFVHSAGGSEHGIKLIPIGEVAARDEFLNIKNVSRDDILVVHRVPPQLLGVVPQNSGGFGNIKDATHVFMVNEIVPLQDRFKELNEWMGTDVINFISVDEYIAQLGAGSLSSGDKLKKAMQEALNS